MVNQQYLFFFLLFCSCCYSACSANIPDHIKKEYGADIQNAFMFQSEGLSTTAMFHFEQGCMKAAKAGESLHKVEAIRNLFVWYRTYGYFLGIIKKDPGIFGQYIGGGKYSSRSNSPKITLNYGTNPERDGKTRDYLLGVTEILSGVLCIWLGPPPYKTAGLLLALEGANRAWDALNSLWIQRDISLLEFQKVSEGIKEAAK